MFTCETLRDQIDGKREDDGGVLLGADGVQSLTFQLINIDGKCYSFITGKYFLFRNTSIWKIFSPTEIESF